MYDFESGDLSLDYANTMNWHGSKNPVEDMKNYSDLVTWGEQAGLINQEIAEQLRTRDAQNPIAASADYERGIQLREAIYRIFSNHYADKPIPEDDLDMLSSVVSQAMSHMKLCPKGSECGWEWVQEIDGVDHILYPVARAAANLLTSKTASRVRECEDDRGCGYLFIDQTRNHSRRWCSMESCGNRAKARRHYSRLQAG